NRLAENLLRRAARVAVSRIERVQAGLQADVDQARGLGDVAAAPRLEELALPAEGTGAQAEHGHAETGSAKLSIFHHHACSLFYIARLAANIAVFCESCVAYEARPAISRC